MIEPWGEPSRQWSAPEVRVLTGSTKMSQGHYNELFLSKEQTNAGCFQGLVRLERMAQCLEQSFSLWPIPFRDSGS